MSSFNVPVSNHRLAATHPLSKRPRCSLVHLEVEGTQECTLPGRQVGAELLSWWMLNKSKSGPEKPVRRRARDQMG